jgi:hypothetical protein
VRRSLAIAGGLCALLLLPLGLSPVTAWLLLPGHLLLSALTVGGALTEGLAGYPERARRWGALYLVASFGMAASLEVGAAAHHGGFLYWGAPYTMALLWGWIPPVIAGFSGPVGQARRKAAVARALRRRTRESC